MAQYLKLIGAGFLIFGLVFVRSRPSVLYGANLSSYCPYAICFLFTKVPFSTLYRALLKRSGSVLYLSAQSGMLTLDQSVLSVSVDFWLYACWYGDRTLRYKCFNTSCLHHCVRYSSLCALQTSDMRLLYCVFYMTFIINVELNICVKTKLYFPIISRLVLG